MAAPSDVIYSIESYIRVGGRALKIATSSGEYGLIDLSPMKAMLANARVIFLRRELKLLQAISYFLARETGKWVHSDVERKSPKEVTFAFVG